MGSMHLLFIDHIKVSRMDVGERDPSVEQEIESCVALVRRGPTNGQAQWWSPGKF